MRLNKIGKKWLIGFICCLVVFTLNFAEATADYTQKQLNWLEHLVSQNNTHAMLQLANYYYDRGEYKKALVYIDKGKKLNDPALISNLGMYYYNGLANFPVDYKKAVSYFQIGAKYNFAASYNMLGNAYSSGKGVKKDIEKAVFYYEKAINLGLKGARYNLAMSISEYRPELAFRQFKYLSQYSKYKGVRYNSMNQLAFYYLTGYYGVVE